MVGDTAVVAFRTNRERDKKKMGYPAAVLLVTGARVPQDRDLFILVRSCALRAGSEDYRPVFRIGPCQHKTKSKVTGAASLHDLVPLTRFARARFSVLA